MRDTVLRLEKISKTFNHVEALKSIDLEVEEGEFLTLLGPSGCGKTTMLRIIAGMDQADSGEIFISDENVTNVPANKRSVNMVFQNYALFPHMTVAQNIAYGLKIKKMPKSDIKRKVQEMLSLIQLDEYGKRMPSELSGGQKQRVAIARALVNNPKVLLLDEPLGALDLQLRRQMQIELKAMQKEMGITFIYITHDQEEAINMSDRIVVMKNGKFSQIGTPEEIYSNPKTDFVARFVGESNIVSGEIMEMNDDVLKISVEGGTTSVLGAGRQLKVGEKIKMAVKPNDIYFPETSHDTCMAAAKQAIADNMQETFCVEVTDKHFKAGMLRIEMKMDNGKIIVASRHGLDANLKLGDRIHIGWQPDKAVIVDKEEEDD